ncbi:MAG: isoprenylcysteine carboxylmethyltransferase family protein [Devosia sp.]
MSYSLPFAVLWCVWFAAWFGAGIFASRPEKRPRLSREARYWAVTAAGGVLLYLNFRTTGGLQVQWTVAGALEWALLVVAAIGLGFTWWARVHLGVLWSGNVTRKPGHRVVETGPYGLVRHPIYTGILLAVYATALLRPGWYGLAGCVVMTLGFIDKIRLEEAFLGEILGSEYAAYRARVPMLVPFLPKRAG